MSTFNYKIIFLEPNRFNVKFELFRTDYQRPITFQTPIITKLNLTE